MIMVETLVADKQPIRLSPSLAGPPQPPTQAGVPAEPPRPLMRELPPADPFPVDALGGRDGRQPIDASARGRPACDVADRATTCNERGSPRR
jgi:hypothetical protein